jgi:DNA polymerase III delta subunit
MLRIFSGKKPVNDRMIIFLYGPDDWRRTEKKRAIIAEFIHKRSDLGVAEFDFASKGALQDAEEFLTTQSLFSAPKLAIIEHAFDEEPKVLAKSLAPFLERIDVTVLIAEQHKPVKALGFLLEKPVLAQEFKTLAGAEWAAFVRGQVKMWGIELTPDAAQFLGDVFQGNTWGLVTELEMIAGLAAVRAAGAKNLGPIARADLAAFDLEVAPNYWGLMTGLKSVDMKRRLYAFESMLALSDPPAKIFNILAAQWQEKTPHMAEYDIAVKSGKVDYEEALVDLLVS